MKLDDVIYAELDSKPQTLDELIWNGSIAKSMYIDLAELKKSVVSEDIQNFYVSQILESIKRLLDKKKVVLRWREVGITHSVPEFIRA